MRALLNLGRFFATYPLTRDAPLQAWTRFAAWQIKSCLRRELQFRWIGGQLLVVRRGMTGATGNIYAGLHEFADMMTCLHFLRPGDLFVDVGANVGCYTVLAAGVCGATTWAFEPDQNTATHLRRNIAINRLDELVTVHGYALGPTQSEVRFTVGLDTMNRVSLPEDIETQMVHQERLDSVAGPICQPVMMKIDVEGYEDEVLRGAKAFLANRWLKLIELETVTPNVADMLEGNNYRRAYYDPFNRELSREPCGPRSSNFLYVQDWPFVTTRLTTANAIDVLGHRI